MPIHSSQKMVSAERIDPAEKAGTHPESPARAIRSLSRHDARGLRASFAVASFAEAFRDGWGPRLQALQSVDLLRRGASSPSRARRAEERPVGLRGRTSPVPRRLVSSLSALVAQMDPLSRAVATEGLCC